MDEYSRPTSLDELKSLIGSLNPLGAGYMLINDLLPI
jgi:hypothetical protein